MGAESLIRLVDNATKRRNRRRWNALAVSAELQFRLQGLLNHAGFRWRDRTM